MGALHRPREIATKKGLWVETNAWNCIRQRRRGRESEKTYRGLASQEDLRIYSQIQPF